MRSPKILNDVVPRYRQNGFTLLEMLIVVGILGILAGSALWLSLDVYRDYEFRNEESLCVAMLYRARDESIVNGKPYGVHIDEMNYSIFSGNEFDPGNPLNKVFGRDSSVSATSSQTLIFQENGEPQSGQASLSLSLGSHQKTIIIEPDGGIVY